MTKLTKSTNLTIAALALALWSLPMAAGADEGGVPSDRDPFNAEARAPVTGSGGLVKMSFATADDTGNSTFSTIHEPVPDMSVSFTSSQGAPMIITYSAYSFAPAGALMYVVARVDGLDAEPGEVQFDGDSDENGNNQWAKSHSFTWVMPPVPPGPHTVEIFFRTSDSISFSGRGNPDGGRVVWLWPRRDVRRLNRNPVPGRVRAYSPAKLASIASAKVSTSLL
jgi:hypothetical protein